MTSFIRGLFGRRRGSPTEPPSAAVLASQAREREAARQEQERREQSAEEIRLAIERDGMWSPGDNGASTAAGFGAWRSRIVGSLLSRLKP